jgi:hypothetical protein
MSNIPWVFAIQAPQRFPGCTQGPVDAEKYVAVLRQRFFNERNDVSSHGKA